jgi:Ca-activated chloride channel homolog
MPSIPIVPIAAFLLLVALQQVIRVDVALVTVGVRVTDSRGRDISGLQAADFSVFEDGVPREIAFFSNESQPITLGILVDRSSSMEDGNKLDRAKDSARALVAGARAGSEFFYIEFDEVVNVAADFTTDRQQLASAIQRTSLGGGTSLYDAVIKGLMLTDRAQLPRRALVVVSDGTDQHSRHVLPGLIRQVRESEIQIFTIGYFSKQEEELFRDSRSRVMRIDGKELDNPRVALEKIAEESGADSFFPKSDKELEQAVKEISEDLRTQYTLSFYPRVQDGENRYHELRVTVRGKGYTVRARPGYGTRIVQ